MILLGPSGFRSSSRRGFYFSSRLDRQLKSDVDQIVGDDAHSHPSFHALQTRIETPVQSVPPLQHADSPFASGSPALAVFKPALLLMFLPRLALRISIPNRDVLDALFLQRLVG